MQVRASLSEVVDPVFSSSQHVPSRCVCTAGAQRFFFTEAGEEPKVWAASGYIFKLKKQLYLKKILKMFDNLCYEIWHIFTFLILT